MLRILFVTSLFSTPRQPTRSLPNTRIARAMKERAAISVVSPLPYYPAALVKSRPDLHALAMVPGEEHDAEGMQILHPRYLHIPKLARSLYPLFYATSIARPLARQIERFAPDVLLTAWAFPDGVAAVALAKAFGLPSVLRVMGSDVNTYSKEPLRRVQIAWALRNATRVIAVSGALRESCVSVGGELTRPFVDVIPTGVDTKTFHPVPRDEARALLGIPMNKRVIVVPARLSREKGIRYFLEAFAELDGDLYGVLVGDGPDRDELRRQAVSLALDERVAFVGAQTEDRMRLYYSAADLVCLPSTEEGWPNVLVESLACGCPWVASRVGGIPEIHALGEGGVLAEVGDAHALARALTEALSRSWDRAAIAARMADLSLEDTARRYVASCETATFMCGRSDPSPAHGHRVRHTAREWLESEARGASNGIQL